MESRDIADAQSRLETLEYRTMAEATSDLDRLIDGFVVDGRASSRRGTGWRSPRWSILKMRTSCRTPRIGWTNAADEARAEAAEKGTIPWEQVKAELEEMDLVR